jgi:N6-adenosine-specific RNA methylase IME4
VTLEAISGEIIPVGEWTPKEAADYVSESWRNAVESIIETGQRLTEAKLRVGHTNWLAAVELMPFGISAADKLMKVGVHPTLSNSEYIPNLPAAWGTLAVLSQLPASEVTALIESGKITPDLQQLEARALVAGRREPDEVKDPLPPKDGTYRCIVIDPPWDIKKIEREAHPDQGKFLDYPTMPLERIADEAWVPVRTHAADDCHLYLWVTQKYLPAGLELMEQWGFRYQCLMTWRKNFGMTPFSWMYDTEHVLFGRKGNLPLNQMGLRLSFDAPVQGHSFKPEVFYERVRAASPGPRIDMFARTEREGFEVWGNEVSDE